MTPKSKGRGAATPRGQAKPPTKEPTTFKEAFNALNPQRRKFVTAYLDHPNATWAAKQAGYSEKTAYSQGARLLKDVEAIRLALRLGWQEAGMTAEEVRARTEEVMRGSLADFMTFETQQRRPWMYRPVSELLAELFKEIDFEERYATRAGLDGDELEAHLKGQARRRREALRMELEMEANPQAVRWVQGPPVLVKVERVDLAKAEERGVLHLLKKSTPTKYGTAIELEDRQHARDQIGKIHGLWGKDDDEPTGDGLPPETGLEELSDDDLQGELRRLLRQDVT